MEHAELMQIAHFLENMEFQRLFPTPLAELLMGKKNSLFEKCHTLVGAP